jgi:hypothetical protein
MKPWVRSLLKIILPRETRNQRLRDLDRYRGPAHLLPLQAGAMIFQSYRAQAVEGFNRYAFIGELLLIIVCLKMSALQGAQMFALLVMLGALSARDAYTHHDLRYKCNSIAQYYLDSATDAAVAGLFVFAAEVFMLSVSPELALPLRVLYRGFPVCLPLIAILRAELRPKPDPDIRFEGDREAIYRKIFVLNILWMATFSLLVMLTMSDRAGSFWDFLRMVYGIVNLGVWRRLQRNVLDAGDLQTLSIDWEKRERARMKSSLPQGLQKHEPFYRFYVILEIMLYVQMAVASAVVLWPWLTGHGDFLKPGISIVSFGIAVLTWKYVKQSNRAAALALA